VPCEPSSPSARNQFIYALICVPFAGLAKHVCESHMQEFGASDPRRMITSMIPTMMGYFVGWAVGNAFLAGLIELAGTNPGLCSEYSGCTVLNAVYTVLVTSGMAVVIIALQPYTQQVECGDGEVIDWLEDWLEDLWQLVVRGASATSMVLWYHTAADLSRVGMENATPFAKVVSLVCFTAVSYFVGAILSVKLELMEERLRAEQRVTPAAWRGALIRYSDVLQKLLGYVAGCLTTDVITTVFSSLGEAPTPAVFVDNVLICSAWTLAATFYLLRAGESSMSADRDSVEAFFLVNSLSFFVAWMWLVVARDLVTMTGRAFDVVASPFGIGEGVTQLASVVVACPAFTVVAWWLQLRLQAYTGQDAAAGPSAHDAREREEMRGERRSAKAGSRTQSRVCRSPPPDLARRRSNHGETDMV
jgi:hypothetical protein